jgi:hypothetical protein
MQLNNQRELPKRLVGAFTGRNFYLFILKKKKKNRVKISERERRKGWPEKEYMVGEW